MNDRQAGYGAALQPAHRQVLLVYDSYVIQCPQLVGEEALRALIPVEGEEERARYYHTEEEIGVNLYNWPVPLEDVPLFLVLFYAEHPDE